MRVIVCVDDKNGIAFNHRRQSRDRVASEKILQLCKDGHLWMNAASVSLFSGDKAQINIDSDFLQKAGKNDYCFVENQSLKPYEEQIEKVYLLKWNRVYPADTWLDLNLTDWKLVSTEEFPGYSHEKLTLEGYER